MNSRTLPLKLLVAAVFVVLIELFTVFKIDVLRGCVEPWLMPSYRNRAQNWLAKAGDGAVLNPGDDDFSPVVRAVKDSGLLDPLGPPVTSMLSSTIQRLGESTLGGTSSRIEPEILQIELNSTGNDRHVIIDQKSCQPVEISSAWLRDHINANVGPSVARLCALGLFAVLLHIWLFSLLLRHRYTLRCAQH